MAAFNRFEQFSEDVANGVHDFTNDTLRVYLSNAAPSASADAVKADLAEIAGGNGYTAGGDDTQNTVSRAGLVTSIVGVDVVVTAAGGPIGPFQYAVLYNDTPTTPADPLIGWWDNGSPVTLQDGNSFTTDFSASMFTVG